MKYLRMNILMPPLHLCIIMCRYIYASTKSLYTTDEREKSFASLHSYTW